MLLSSALGFSQTSEMVTGQVRDSISNEPISQATVILDGIRKDKKITYYCITDEYGFYLFSGVEPGSYMISAEAEGYFPSNIIHVEIFLNQPLSIDFLLLKIAPILISAIPGFEEITLIWEPIPEAPINKNKTGHFNFNGGNPSSDIWTIYIGEAKFEGPDMVAGDEIGVFDGDILVGAFTLDQVCTPDNQFDNELHAYSVLRNGDPGYTAGHNFTFIAWVESTNMESDLFDYVFSDPYGGAWIGDVFPSGPGQYSMAEITFAAYPPCPRFRVYYEDGTLIADYVFGVIYTDINLIAGQEYCYYITQMFVEGGESQASNILCAIPLPELLGAISGTVTDENMNPIEGAIIIVEGTSHTATTGEDGDYLITDVEPGVYEIIASSYGYYTEYKPYQEVISGETTFVDFILISLYGSIEGIVYDSLNNIPIEGAYVTVNDIRNDKKTSYTCSTDENGYYYFSDLEPGIWNLTAIYYDEFNLFSTSLEILSGQSTYLDIQLISIAPFLLGVFPGIEEITLEWLTSAIPKTNHFIFEGGIASDPIWTIYIGEATKGGIDLVAGDEIAIFDGETIVGVFELTQVCTQGNQFDNALQAFNTLISGPGYTPGNAYSFKAWSENSQSEYDVFDITLSDPYGGAWTEDVFPPDEGQYSMAEIDFLQWITPIESNVYYEDGTLVAANVPHIFFKDTELIGGQEYCYYITRIMDTGEESIPSNILCAVPLSLNAIQSYNLLTGYQLISTRIIPENPDMLSVFEDILNDNLDFVRNSLGQTLRKIGPNWVNGIGDWIVEEGYLAKMLNNDLLAIEGVEVEPTNPIPLEVGYQFISYFPEMPMDALLAFETIINDNLDFIRNSNGQTLRKIGPNWVNGIGDCHPCEGYLVKMLANGEIVYPASAKSSGKANAVPKHFTFEGGNAADPVFTIYIDGLEIGDEIAAFDGEIFVGAIKINSENKYKNELPIFSTLNSGKGYTSGNPIILKVWDKSENQEYNLTNFTFSNPYGDAWTKNIFPSEDGEYSLLHFSTSGISDENEKNDISIYPNPTTGIITIGNLNLLGFQNLTGLNVEITDITGKIVFNSDISNNSSSIKIDLSQLEKGVYFLNLNGKDFNQVNKIVIQ